MFVENYIGGAELTSEAIIRESLMPIAKLNSANVTSKIMEQNNKAFWIFGNFSSLSEDCILYAIKTPMDPPTNKKINTYVKPIEKFPIDKKVTVIAIIIPKIPNKLPFLDVSGDDNPLKAKINNTPEIK